MAIKAICGQSVLALCAIALMAVAVEGYSDGSPMTTIYAPDRASYVRIERIGDRSRIGVYNGLTHASTTLLDEALRYDLGSDSVIWHSNRLLEVKIRTGSPGVYSVFYSTEKDRASDRLYFVMAVDKTRMLALQGQEQVLIVDIFDPTRKTAIDRDYQNTAIKYLVFEADGTFFDNDGNLHLAYFDSNKRLRSETMSREAIVLGQ